MLASLLFSAVPVAASELAWGTETIPSTTNNVIVNAVKIQDLAVASDGLTVYAAVGSTTVYKSTDGGKTWGTKTANVAATRVAVAPDDANLFVVASATAVDVSTNGGTSFTSLSTVQESGQTAVTAIADLAVSPADGSYHYIGVAGDEVTPLLANVWYYKLGAVGAAWTELNTKNGFNTAGTGAASPPTNALALEFSPSFASDKMVLVVTFDSTADEARFHAYNFNYSLWNVDAALTSYPVQIVIVVDSGLQLTAATGAISLDPSYLGSDEATRVAFVGLDAAGVAATDDDDIDGIYRLSDTSVKALKQNIDIFSIDFNGINLVAGQVSANAVYRSADPLASSPSVSTTSTLKRLLGTNVVVAWAGSYVFAATRGTFSAFGISRDNGASFNGLSMVDYSGTVVVRDMAVSAAGIIYLMTEDNANAYALWRYAGTAWEMVFNKATNTTLSRVRIAPNDPNTVYIAEDTTSQTLYYSSTGGDTKWFLRTAKANVSDMAVESASVVYTSDGGNVYQSKNNAFTWGDAKSTGVDTVWVIKSLGTDKLIAGGTGGKVAYSTDGGQTWSKPHATSYPFTSGNVFVTASGLASGDFIYAASSVANQNVVRWQIGQTGTTWSDIITGTLGTNTVATGIGLSEGVLFVLSNDATADVSGFSRTLSPSTADSTTTWSSALTATTIDFLTTPDALILSSGSTKVWAIDTAANAVYSYLDTLTVAKVVLVGPADAASVKVNLISGGIYSISFSWSRPSKATIYDLQVALDSGFTEKLTVGGSPITESAATIALSPTGGLALNPDTKYYWRVRVSSTGPIQSNWSDVRSFTIAGATPPPVVTITPAPPAPPAPIINLPAPVINLPAPTTITIPPAPIITIPPAPAPPAPIAPAYIWAVVIIGAVLVIAVIILIVRTRRPV